jgi:hypothetical protein
VTFKKSRVRESRMLGSVRAKAEWLSYSTIPFIRTAEFLLGPRNLASLVGKNPENFEDGTEGPEETWMIGWVLNLKRLAAILGPVTLPG